MAGRWELATSNPHPALAGTVGKYVGFFEWSPAPLRRRETAQDRITVILNLGPPLTISGQGERPTAYGSFVAGKIDAYAITEFTGVSQGIEIQLTPQGAHSLVGVPLHEISTVVTPLEDLLGGFAAELVERLADTESWSERFDLLDREIARILEDAPRGSPDVAYAWDRLQASAGHVAIGTLTDELGCSRRHLSSRFREQIGVTPKTAARVIRFRRAVALLGKDDGRRFADIAAESSYYDQAHMNREFRELGGTTPGSFLAARLPSGIGISAE